MTAQTVKMAGQKRSSISKPQKEA